MATDSILRPGELKEILLKEIQAADLAEIDVREVGTALEVKDGIARIYGLTSAMAGEMLEFTSSETGEKVTGQALNLEEDNIGAVIFGDYLVLREGDEVRRTGRVLEVPVGPALWGGWWTPWADRWTDWARSTAPRPARWTSSRPASSSGSR